MVKYATEENLRLLREKNHELKEILGNKGQGVQVCLDADVFEWLKQSSEEVDYQRKANAMLRESFSKIRVTPC